MQNIYNKSQSKQGNDSDSSVSSTGERYSRD